MYGTHVIATDTREADENATAAVMNRGNADRTNLARNSGTM